MEVKIIELGKDHVKLIIKGEDHTFLNLLQHYLLEDENVEIARYTIPHPLVGEPEFFIKTRGKNPLKALEDANNKIIEVCEEVISQLKSKS